MVRMGRVSNKNENTKRGYYIPVVVHKDRNSFTPNLTVKFVRFAVDLLRTQVRKWRIYPVHIISHAVYHQI